MSAHLMIPRDHIPYFPLLLLVAGCNDPKPGETALDDTSSLAGDRVHQGFEAELTAVRAVHDEVLGIAVWRFQEASSDEMLVLQLHVGFDEAAPDPALAGEWVFDLADTTATPSALLSATAWDTEPACLCPRDCLVVEGVSEWYIATRGTARLSILEGGIGEVAYSDVLLEPIEAGPGGEGEITLPNRTIPFSSIEEC